jgi:hypothetical protein
MKKIKIIFIVLILTAGIVGFARQVMNGKKLPKEEVQSPQVEALQISQPISEFDEIAYDKKLLEMANLEPSASTTENLWPVKTEYPLPGALLPFSRVVAYYGNLYSRFMGVLGEFPEEVMLKKLQIEVEKWQKADPDTKAVPALHYIAVVAQAGQGKDGKYRARMPDKEIDKVLDMAKKIDAIVFLDVQAGLSDLQTEVPLLEKYLKLENVHLGVDPEFAMKTRGGKPGQAIGTLDAQDINFVSEYLAKLVLENNLPPKILVVHRFTRPMLTNSEKILTRPEVQLVVNMDGFGHQAVKLNTYRQYVKKEPVQFTGFKLFYYNDTAKKGSQLLQPEDLLKLSPRPVYIQYQ